MSPHAPVPVAITATKPVEWTWDYPPVQQAVVPYPVGEIVPLSRANSTSTPDSNHAGF
ncbi:hypothetical protein AVEN_35252-1, partial [Araneus ventricosus]